MEKYYRFEMTEMAAGRLKSSQNYQRGVSGKHVLEISKNFEWDIVTPIRVSERGGVYYVFDGQHTLASIKSKYGDDVIVPVQLYRGLTYEREAELTAKLDRFRKKMKRIEVDNALLESGDNDRERFVSLCNDLGWNVAFNTRITNKQFYVQNPSYVFEMVYMKHGAAYTGRFLNLFTNAFSGDCSAMRSPIQRGINLFMESYKDEYSDATLTRALRGKEPDIIIGNMKDDTKHTGDKRYAHTILLYYNKVTNKKLKSKFERGE